MSDSLMIRDVSTCLPLLLLHIYNWIGVWWMYHAVPFFFFFFFFFLIILFSRLSFFRIMERRHLTSIKLILPPPFVKNRSRLPIVHIYCLPLSLPPYCLYSFLTSHCLLPFWSVSGILNLLQSLTDSLSPISLPCNYPATILRRFKRPRIMHVLSTILPALGLLAHVSSAAYTLRDDYGTSDSFFDRFNFYTVCPSVLVLSLCPICNTHPLYRTPIPPMAL